MIYIDKRKAIYLLRKVVKGKENYTYHLSVLDGDMCRYVENHKPSCGIGQVLFEAGVPIEVLEAMDRDSDGGPTSIQFYESHDFHLTPAARRIFARFQYLQDRGETWGNALEEALKA